jgi:hypothetical protein
MSFVSPKALGTYNLYIIKVIEINRGKNHNAIQWVFFQWMHEALTTCTFQSSLKSTMQKKKKKVEYSIIHEAQWNFLIHNKVKKWTSSKNSDFCPFLSCEEQGTLKNNKMKITKIQKKFLLHLIFKLCIKLLCQLWLCYACTCKVRGLRTPSLWIINPSFVNKDYLVKMVNLQLTLLKCNMNSNN